MRKEPIPPPDPPVPCAVSQPIEPAQTVLLPSTPEEAQQEADVREMYEANPSPGLKELIDESVSDNALLGVLDDEALDSESE